MTDRGPRWQCRAVPMAMVLLTSGGIAEAQQDAGPVVVTRRSQLEWFQLEDLRAAIEFSYQLSLDEQDSGPAGRIKDREDLFREILELDGNAFMGHPNLVDLDFNLRFNFEQSQLDAESQNVDGARDEFLNEFDINALILRNSDVPIRVFGRRSQITVDQAFGGTLDSVVTEYGTRLYFSGDQLRHQLAYSHRDQDQNDRFGNADFGVQQDTINSNGSFTIDQGNVLRWDYSFDQVEESGTLRRNNDFDEHDLFAVHEYKFGADDEHLMRSAFTFLDVSGDFPFQRLRVDERLRMRHSDDLISQWDYAFNEDERPGTTQRRHRGQAQVRYQLFDSLYSIASAGGSDLSVVEEDFSSREFFGNLDLTYTKKVPLGSVDATVNLNVNRRDNTPRGATIQVTDEARTFSAAGLITITRRNVVIPSIFITDVTGLIVYSEGPDYTVQDFGIRVEIRRVLGGMIAAGQSVLIDYQLGPEPGGVTDTLAQGYTFRYNFQEGPLRGLSPYVRYLNLDEMRPSSQQLLGFPEADVEELTLGAEYNYQRWFALAEWQDHKSSISPFRKTRYELRYVQPLGRDSRFILSGDYDEIDNLDQDFRSRVFTVSTRWNQRFSEHLRANLLLQYVDQDDDRGFGSQGFEQQLTVDWNYRQTTINASVRHSGVDGEFSDTQFLTFFIGIRRSF